MITYTVGKTGADFTSLAAALAILVGTTLSDETKIRFIDDEDYEEINAIQSITTSTDNWLRIEGKFSRAKRTKLFHSTIAGFLLTVTNQYVSVKGIDIDRSEAIDDDRSGIVLTGYWGHIEISHCRFYGNGYYHQDAILRYPYATDFKVWNNLFKMWGHAGVYAYTTNWNETHEIWNNTFVKCQECIDYGSSVQLSNDVSVWNNIFDMDDSYLKECTAFACILAPNATTPTAFKKLENNLYYIRTHTAMYVYADASIFTPGPLKFATLAAMQAVYPTVETEGIEDDPDFVVYCSDYHLLSDSPAIESADGNIPVDDNDGETRTSPGNRGCYEDSPGMNLESSPQLDRIQNATFWIELEDTRGSGSPRKISIGLDYQRIL